MGTPAGTRGQEEAAAASVIVTVMETQAETLQKEQELTFLHLLNIK